MSSDDEDDDDRGKYLRSNKARILQHYENFRSNLRDFFTIELKNPFGETREFNSLKILQESQIDSNSVMVKLREITDKDESGRKTVHPMFFFDQKKLSKIDLMMSVPLPKIRASSDIDDGDDEADVVVDGGENN